MSEMKSQDSDLLKGPDTAASSLPEAYTVSAAIAAVGLGRTKIYEEMSSGRLKSFVLCGRRLILRQDLLDWLRAAREAAD